MKKTSSVAEQVMRFAREVQPELWERTEQVARIIDPAAFAEGWVLISRDASAKRLHETRTKYMQSIALSKAQDVLKYLGVNADADWYAILSKMSEEKSA